MSTRKLWLALPVRAGLGTLWRAVAVAAVLALAACGGGGSSGTSLPTDALDHDASGAFAGGWFGTLTLSIAGQTQSAVNVALDVAVTGRNTLTFPGLCGDGGGPSARVTSDSAFTVASRTCPIPVPALSCTLTWQIQGGSGSVSGNTIQLSVNGPASGCGAPDGTTLSLVFAGTKSSSISSLDPPSATAGSPGFTLKVTGTAFPTDAVVLWNGSPRATTFVSSTLLQAQIAADDVATPGTAQISVASASSGTSQPVRFDTGAQAGVTILELPVRDMVWDPARQKIYASVDPFSPTNPNTITIVDPSTGTFVAGAGASFPNRLAISDDGQFLYAGMDGAAAVQRFALPALIADVRIPLGTDPSFGSYYAGDLQVAPGAPRTVAVSLFTPVTTVAAQGGVVIFDDAAARTTRTPGFDGTGLLFDSLQWGTNATALYAAKSEDAGFDFYTLAVDASGVTLAHDYAGALPGSGNRIHFDPVTRLVYSEDGRVIDPATGAAAGFYPASGLMVPDGRAGVAVFVTPDSTSSSIATVRTFDLTRFTQIGTFAVQRLRGQPTGRVLRYGSDGIAFLTTGDQLVLTHAPGLPRP